MAWHIYVASQRSRWYHVTCTAKLPLVLAGQEPCNIQVPRYLKQIFGQKLKYVPAFNLNISSRDVQLKKNRYLKSHSNFSRRHFGVKCGDSAAPDLLVLCSNVQQSRKLSPTQRQHCPLQHKLMFVPAWL